MKFNLFLLGLGILASAWVRYGGSPESEFKRLPPVRVGARSALPGGALQTNQLENGSALVLSKTK